MNRRHFLEMTGATMAAFAGCATTAKQRMSRAANVVLIVADDLGYGELGSYGGDIATPHIDSIACGGVRFTSGYVTCPVCAPTRAGMLTGRYQQRFGFEFNPGPITEAAPDFGLPLTERTLADRLKALGYATGMAGKWHLGFEPQFHPQQRGFDEFYGFLGGAHSYGSVNDRNRGSILRGATAVNEVSYLTFDFAREANAFIDRHTDQPFFLYLPFNAVHAPLEVPTGYLERVAHIQDDKRRKFAAMLIALDEAVGSVLSKLAEKGIDDNTLVIFISDNGGPTRQTTSRNTPLRDQKTSVFEGGVRVPFMMRWPAEIAPNTTFDAPVVSLDILPTCLRAAGGEVESAWKIDGVDLLPYVTRANKHAPHESLFWRVGRQRAIRHGNLKMVMQRTSTVWELYDLETDIAESRDLAGANPEKVKGLDAIWSEWNHQLEEPRWEGRRGNAGLV